MASTQRRPCLSTERKPQLLKDLLLRDDSGSCASAGFNSFPRFQDPKLPEEPHPASRTPPRLQRSRSRSRVAAEAAVSALHKLLNAVKPPPAKKPSEKDTEIVVRVRVKDILRWTSLRDLIDGLDEEEKAQPLDCIYASPGVRPGLDGGAGPHAGEEGEKRNVGGEDPMMAGAGTALSSDHVGPPKASDEDHQEQQSPISVLDSPFRDDADSVSSFDQTLANVERTKERLLESIKWLESLAGVKPINSDDDENDPAEETTKEEEEEEPREAKCRARHLIDHVEAKGSMEKPDFFMDEHKGKSFSCKDKEFEEQQNQLVLELEVGMLNALLDELLSNLVCCSDGFN